MNRKLRVGVLFGGKSAEHEISLLSAKTIIEALDKDKYEVILVGIDKNGEWHLRDAYQYLMHEHDPKLVHLHQAIDSVALVPKSDGNYLVSLTNQQEKRSLDVVFPILHGTNGEDGTIQGLLKLAEIPFVGAGVLGSSIGMDKDVMKRLLRDAGIPTAKFLTFDHSTRNQLDFQTIAKTLGLPFFIKPANLGSSVGISKVKTEEDFWQAINKAFLYDRKILIEEFIAGREIECSVLGNDNPIASLPGEVIPQHDFYSYEAKYVDENGALFQIPVTLDPQLIEKVQDMAIRSFKTLCCEGMARVDFFLKANGDVIFNEINTIPGFTKISMYPKLWEVSGISYSALIDKLIELALERSQKEKMLKTVY